MTIAIDPNLIIQDTLQRLASESVEAEVERQIAEIPAYRTRERYEAFLREAGMSVDHQMAFERAGIVLQPKQVLFAVAARQADDPVNGPNEIGMGGAKGPGKSFAVFAQTTIDDCFRFPGLKVLYLRNTAKSATEQLDDIATRVFRHVTGVTRKQGRIDYDNGSRVIIGGYNDDSSALAYLGIEYDIIIVEEATQLSPRVHSQIRMSNRSSKVYNGVRFRPRRYYTTNPLGIAHQWFKKRFVDNELARERGEPYDHRKRFIFATIDDNVFVNEEYREVLEELAGPEQRAYLFGDWNVSAGAFFDEWDERVHVIPPLDDISWMRTVWCSMDFGFHHWNIIYLHGEDGDGTIYTIDELAHRKAHPDEIVADLLPWLGQYGLTPQDLDTFLVGADAFAITGASRTTVQQQYLEHGIELFRAYVGPGSRTAGAMYLTKLLGSPSRGIAPRWYVSSRCTKLRDCIPFLEHDPHKPEDVKKWDTDDKGVGGDDPYDAVRYGLYRPHLTKIA